MKNAWIRFGCFLTGINYNVLRTCSEVSRNQVKKYTAAMVIVMIIWAFVGFAFTQRYLQAGIWGSIAGSLIMIILIIQIERQIILTVGKIGAIFWFRSVIAIMMAILGSTILDQIIFKNDIDLEQVSMINEKVNAALPGKTQDLRQQIFDLDSTIQAKENERSEILEDISKNPTIKSVTDQSLPVTVSNTVTDTNKVTRTTQRVVHSNSRTITSIPNPKAGMISPLDVQIKNLRVRKDTLDNNLLNARFDLEKEIKSKIGFLDELKLMVGLLKSSGVALTFYIILFLFLLGLELFVVFSKKNDESIDYDEKIIHAQTLHKRKIQALT